MNFRKKEHIEFEEKNTDEVISLYINDKYDINEIAEKFFGNKKEVYVIRQILLKNKIKLRTRSEIKQKLDKKYSNTIGYNGRKVKIKTDYFKTWSDDMAYILGFLATDGTIRVKDENNYDFKLTLKEKDKYILEEIAKRLVEDGQITISEENIYLKQTQKFYKSCSLTITNKEIVQDLISLGLVPNKTFVLKGIKDLPNDYIIPFLRGMFDGDGSMGIIKNKNGTTIGSFRCRLVSASEEMLQFVRDKLNFYNIPFRKIYKRTINQNSIIYSLEYCGDSALKICKLFYEKDNILYLKRKRKVYEDYIKASKII